jgi:hypothetical protein
MPENKCIGDFVFRTLTAVVKSPLFRGKSDDTSLKIRIKFPFIFGEIKCKHCIGPAMV